MADEILHYYERELSFIRELGVDFARKYPKLAGRLQLDAESCEDPHVERLIESFALLCGRVHKKIDDDFPEITESLFQVLYPQYVSPIPSMAVVTFEPIIQAIPPTGYRIEPKTLLYTAPINGVPCQFTTGYPVTLWPVEVDSVTLTDPRKPVRNALQTLSVKLKAGNGVLFSQLTCQNIRFFLNGLAQHVNPLYEHLFNNVCHVELAWNNRQGVSRSIALPPGAIHPVGFAPDESLLPNDLRTSSAFPLLFEYFSFPEKFLFLDLFGIEQLKMTDVGESVEILFYFDKAVKSNLLITKETFSLNVTPVINLFSKTAEPIRVDHEKSEYPIVPDLRRMGSMEIYSVDRVVSTVIGSSVETVYRPFYSLEHSFMDAQSPAARAYWQLKRRKSGRLGDEGTDLFISFLDLDNTLTNIGTEVVNLHITCTNRDLPSRIAIGNPDGDFQTETAVPVAAIRCLVKPTPPRRPPLGGALQWRLISHLSLNHLSLVTGGEAMLKEMLRLYDFDDSPTTRQLINGIVAVNYSRITKRVGPSFCRGIRVLLTFDEEKYVGTGLYLFASVLECFIGQYVSINSFSQLCAETLQRKERLKEWPPRNGQRILL